MDSNVLPIAILAVIAIFELVNELRGLVSRVRSVDRRTIDLWLTLTNMERDVAGCKLTLEELRIINPYAHMLGRVVEAHKYEAYDWEPCVVVGVGWHGSLGLRKLSELDKRGFWLKHHQVPTHVREIEDGQEGRVEAAAREDEVTVG